jgi:hypothetical protein
MCRAAPWLREQPWNRHVHDKTTLSRETVWEALSRPRETGQNKIRRSLLETIISTCFAD